MGAIAAYNCTPMSQVTRCPSCGTRFKVVADQLRISQGWVRCGRCQSVFDASEDLQPLADDAPQAAAESSPVAVPVAVAEHDEAAIAEKPPESIAVSEDAVDEGKETDADPEVLDEAHAVQGEASESGHQQDADKGADKDAGDEAGDEEGKGSEEYAESDQQAESELNDEAGDSEAETTDKVSTEQDATDAGEMTSVGALLSTDVDDVRREVEAEQTSTQEESESADAALDEPGFVRQARRKAFWHSTGMRIALLLGSVLAVAGVAGQYAWHQRDALAAQYPQLTPMLQQVCQHAGCELGARREIADVVISGSGFKQLADAQQYQWSLTLENRSDAPVATPVAELTLTDAQDKPLLRRVVDLRELGAPAQLQARQEWSVNVPVQVQELSAPVSGYRALVFYP